MRERLKGFAANAKKHLPEKHTLNACTVWREKRNSLRWWLMDDMSLTMTAKDKIAGCYQQGRNLLAGMPILGGSWNDGTATRSILNNLRSAIS
ncbi:hypothetical protein, partial [Alishewanella sp. WH16-1]|uniref:hypothetical protein n=1 Tax=Alishewanella sp. WH16-1 TaxID=1651088 RepID=UPI001E3A40CC